MKCLIQKDDVAEEHVSHFTRGVFRGALAYNEAGTPLAAASSIRRKILSGDDGPLTSREFWEYQGAMTGLAEASEQCPHCGSKSTCKGPWTNGAHESWK